MSTDLTIKKVFLLDFIGAMVSFIMLGFVLPKFQSLIGMPYYTLYALAGIAASFFIYSLGCYLLELNQPRKFLKIIAFANLGYCLISMTCMIHNFSLLTKLGIAYFALEKVIVLGIAFLEWKTANDSIS